jgi:hypothetical protein
MRRFAIVLALACAIAAPVSGQNRLFPFEDPELNPLATDRLERFESRAAFRAYVEAVRQADTERNTRRIRPVPQGANPKAPGPGSCPPDQECDEDVIVVTGSRIATNPVITNNQENGVDEGDIVKQIGDYLVVLQDGRLFSADLRPDGATRLQFADRRDVYADPDHDIWYDEMLVSGNMIVVTGYSYEDSASELTILQMSDQGVFSRIDAFQIGSNDYYDPENYASRMIDGHLVLHVPIYLDDIDLESAQPWPVLRRWYRYGKRTERRTRALRLFDTTDIYRPVQRLLSPVIHTITACDIAGFRPGHILDCTSQAFIGGERAEFYVTPAQAYLWSAPGWEETNDWQYAAAYRDCPAGQRSTPDQTLPSRIHRLDLASGRLDVAAVAGEPIDQFSMQGADGRFRALVAWANPHCSERYGAGRMLDFALLDLPDGRFGQRIEPLIQAEYSALPTALDPAGIENRFTATHLVYGWSTSDYSFVPEQADSPLKPAPVIVVPLARPDEAVRLTLPHSLLRMEVMGQNIIATGYRHTEGLHLSHIALDDTPRITGSVVLPGRFETEGRSHAFNSMVRPDGSGMMGLPTRYAPVPSWRWWWGSEASDVSFLALDRNGALEVMGSLSSGDLAERSTDYDCEVSCIDWYGNSRPIFTDNRIFALSATDLIEGQITDRTLKGIFHLDLTAGAPAGALEPVETMP